MSEFVLIGAAGYIAPRHLKAIKDTGNQLLAAYDPYDGIGILDSYFPETSFFTEFERFDRFVDRQKREGRKTDFVSICSPNYLHDAHIRYGLRNGADVICEKPLVLNPWNIDPILELEKEYGANVYTILQLRLHPAIIALKEKIDNSPTDKVYDIDLTYITSRGNWYYVSWKGDMAKSGGIATNIGVHFFDMLSWVFGNIKENRVHINDFDRASGYLEFNKARVRWFLSINPDTLPTAHQKTGKRTYRLIQIDNEELEFSEGFTELHTESYKGIMSGSGFRAADAQTSIEIVHTIRNSKPLGLVGDYHPFAALPVSVHPFNAH
jgi:UDP-N-acetyl-2-amino-2-deoxyglucuronate dehydrogenase